MEAYFMTKKKSYFKPTFSARPSRSQKSRSFASPKRGRGVKIDPARFVNKAVMDQKENVLATDCKFQDFALDKQLKHRIESRGYFTATPIQVLAIPPVLKGADVVGIADTGTGKTAAFLIPLINKALASKLNKVLIVTPTRELADQINKELKEFAKGLHIFSACCVGGTSYSRQLYELGFENSFIVGTPGRLKDLIERNRINLSKFKTIVLDEADRMLDMGFVEDMRFLMARMPQDRQTLLFSATMSSRIDSLIGEFLREPVKIAIKTRDTSRNVEQDVVKVASGKSKIETLHNLLRKEEFAKVLIFGRTKYGVEHLYETLVKRGFKAESIHGNKNFSKRQRALEMFKQNSVNILVATDVAARGLDIADITHVINYDLPETYDDYIHRIGRTGRNNKFGKALTFIE
jgi:superfamily II DNA/RNA helicase